MKAMILEKLSSVGADATPLVWGELARPRPKHDQVLVRVLTCGVCHTELDVIEGRTPPPRLPVVPGHQVVGRVESRGVAVRRVNVGDRVGVAWIHSACGACRFCREGRENLCPDFRATGRDVDGGYAEYMTAPEEFTFGIPAAFSDSEAAPLLCAGAIGYRSLELTGLRDGQNLGLTGFGASGHLVLKMAQSRYPAGRVFVFARSEDEQEFARKLGAVWAGYTTDRSPEPLAAIIDTTPAWKPIVEALGNLEPGGRLVINAIRKENADKAYLQRLGYAEHLWMEREIKTVANVARRDVIECLELTAEVGIRPEVEELPLREANAALVELKRGGIRGAKVLRIGSDRSAS
jgi:propanol-preferring alcohol dehydrogenase